MLRPAKVPDTMICGTRVRCWDEPSFLDRYTVLYMSEKPRVSNGCKLFPGMESGEDPRGYSGHIEGHPGVHLGKRIPFHDLPESVRRMIRNDLNKDED